MSGNKYELICYKVFSRKNSSKMAFFKKYISGFLEMGKYQK